MGEGGPGWVCRSWRRRAREAGSGAGPGWGMGALLKGCRGEDWGEHWGLLGRGAGSGRGSPSRGRGTVPGPHGSSARPVIHRPGETLQLQGGGGGAWSRPGGSLRGQVEAVAARPGRALWSGSERVKSRGRGGLGWQSSSA